MKMPGWAVDRRSVVYRWMGQLSNTSKIGVLSLAFALLIVIVEFLVHLRDARELMTSFLLIGLNIEPEPHKVEIRSWLFLAVSTWMFLSCVFFFLWIRAELRGRNDHTERTLRGVMRAAGHLCRRLFPEGHSPDLTIEKIHFVYQLGKDFTAQVRRTYQVRAGKDPVYFMERGYSVRDYADPAESLIDIEDVYKRQGKERYQADSGKPCPQAGEASGKWMPCSQAAYRANRTSSWNRNFRGLGGIPSLVPVLLDSSFAIIFYRLLTCTGKAIHETGNLHHRAIGKNHRGKVHIQLRLSLHAPCAHNAVHHTLDINPGRNHDPVADNDRKSRSEVDAIAGFGAPGIDAAAQLQQYLGAGWDGVDLLLWSRLRSGRRRRQRCLLYTSFAGERCAWTRQGSECARHRRWSP